MGLLGLIQPHVALRRPITYDLDQTPDGKATRPIDDNHLRPPEPPRAIGPGSWGAASPYIRIFAGTHPNRGVATVPEA